MVNLEGENKMMTQDPEVKREVLMMVKKMVRPGQPVGRRIWREAYEMVRRNAIQDTILWKRLYITIEETPL